MLEVLRLQSDRKPKDSMGFEQEKQHQRDEEEEGNCVDSSFHTGETISSEGYNCNDPEEYGSSVVPDFPHSNVKKECPVHEDDEEEGAQQQQYDNTSIARVVHCISLRTTPYRYNTKPSSLEFSYKALRAFLSCFKLLLTS